MTETSLGVPAGRDETASPGDQLVAPPVAVVPGSLGILGGTFDPIHLGHLAIAEEAREALGLERVLFVPAAGSPFKTGRFAADAEHRLAMVAAAVAGNAAFACSRIEIDRPAPSFTVDTLERIAADRCAADEPWLILSAEAAAGLPRWRAPERILELARVAVLPRARSQTLDEEWVRQQFPGREDRFRFLTGPLWPISGSVVRRRVAAGRSVRYLVPDAVARYIEDHALYAHPA